MKLFSLLVVVASCAVLPQIARCQSSPQCQDLDVENTGEATSGSDLTVCRNDTAQCCLQNYITTVTGVAENRLSMGLRLQMRETSVTFNNTLALIQSYFALYFSESWIGSLPMLGGAINFDQLNATVGTFIEGFVENLSTTNVSQLITQISTAIGNAAGQFLGRGNQNTAMCVSQLLLNNVNQTDIAILVRGLTTVQKAVNSLNRIAAFLYRYRMNTEFTFPQNCVRRFVELNFCARCTRRVPPLCSNTCGALFRGCLSPYYTVLSRQFDVLWNVSRQVLRITNDTLQNLFMNERNLIDLRQVLAQLARQCPGASFSPMGKRQTVPTRNTRARFIPLERMQELRNLDGKGFTYDNAGGRGPIICRPSNEEVTFCARSTTRDQSSYCNATVDCTSSCRCFDGMNERTDNSPEFTMNGIDEQDENPAIDLTESELTTIVADIGTPASAFLMQNDFTSTAPEGVVVPSDDNGSVRVTMSMAVLLMAVIFVAMLINE